MSHGWDTRTMSKASVSHLWARRIQREPLVQPAARNVLNNVLNCTGSFDWNFWAAHDDLNSNFEFYKIKQNPVAFSIFFNFHVLFHLLD